MSVCVCVEVGYDGRLGVKTKGWLASNTALLSGMTFMGCADSNDGDGEVLADDDCFSAKEPNFLSFLPPVFVHTPQYVHYCISNMGHSLF